MKIEKLNDNQIRCTLTREDLTSRKIKLSELAYGSEKAKSLFREMMQQASLEYGFEANDIPLMIEAIPVSVDTLVLIITKVDNPDELDTRFAKFAPTEAYDSSESMSDPLSSLKIEGADDILNLFQKIKEAHKSAVSSKAETAEGSETSDTSSVELPAELKKMFGFHSLDDVIRIAKVLKGTIIGENSLYKEDNDGGYYLILSPEMQYPEEFNKICNIISEYSEVLKYSSGTEAFFLEHGKTIIHKDALQKLAAI